MSYVRERAQAMLMADEVVPRMQAIGRIYDVRIWIAFRYLKLLLFGFDANGDREWLQSKDWIDDIYYSVLANARTRITLKKRDRLTIGEIKENLYEEWLTEKDYVNNLQDYVEIYGPYIPPVNYDLIIGRYDLFLELMEKIAKLIRSGKVERDDIINLAKDFLEKVAK